MQALQILGDLGINAKPKDILKSQTHQKTFSYASIPKTHKVTHNRVNNFNTLYKMFYYAITLKTH